MEFVETVAAVSRGAKLTKLTIQRNTCWEAIPRKYQIFPNESSLACEIVNIYHYSIDKQHLLLTAWNPMLGGLDQDRRGVRRTLWGLGQGRKVCPRLRQGILIGQSQTLQP